MKQISTQTRPGVVVPLRTITVGHVCGPLKEPDKPTLLMQVAGFVDRIKEETSKLNGEIYHKLYGSFKALRWVDKLPFESNVCILPYTGEMIVVATFKERNVQTKFLHNIGYRPSNGARGYEFVVTSLYGEKRDANPLDEMLAAAAGLNNFEEMENESDLVIEATTFDQDQDTR